jgi:uncharacterized protein YndB with AHSA1/START domain
VSAIEIDTVIERPRQEVFDYLARGENLPQWMSTFDSVEPASQSEPGQGTTYQYKMSRGAESTFEYSEFVPGQRIAWAGPPVQAGPGTISPRGSFELDDKGGGTHLLMSLDPELSASMKAMGLMMKRQMKKDAKEDLVRLKQLLEGGG